MNESMKRINPEHIKKLIELINHIPYIEHLDMKVCEIGMGYARIEVLLQRKHLNIFGAAHGGVYSSMIDTAAFLAVYCELDDVVYTTLDLSINNLSNISEGKIIVEGRSIKIGRSICLAEATAKDIHGKLLAHGTSKLMILNEKQSIEHAIESMGYRAIPPKFFG